MGMGRPRNVHEGQQVDDPFNGVVGVSQELDGGTNYKNFGAKGGLC